MLNLRALIARDLADAAIPALSSDRRFATAYNAALQACTMAIACSGYRVTTRAGHHAVAFEAVTFAVGPSAQSFADYFDTCRRKRNTIDYHNTSVATDTEADEILSLAKAFHALIEAWIAAHHPALAATRKA
jgi:uncharacterized protein (UPF0332 family)